MTVYNIWFKKKKTCRCFKTRELTPYSVNLFLVHQMENKEIGLFKLKPQDHLLMLTKKVNLNSFPCIKQ